MERRARLDLATRFEPDVRIDDALARERLLRQLSDAAPARARVVVVRAPAGFGKTTLCAQRSRQLQESGVATVWLNCMEGDRKAADLRALLGEALRHAGLVPARAPAKLDALLATACERAGEIAVFIDNDEHLAGTDADEQLTALAQVLPEGVTLYLAGRRPPDAFQSQRWLGGHWRVLDPALLCFSTDEAARFHQQAGCQAPLAALLESCEGWPVAMQFARRQDAQGSGAIGAAIGGAQVEADAWLATQIVDPLDAADRAFLVETAILDEVRADIADAVRERADSGHHITRLAALSPMIRPGTSPLSIHVVPWLRQHLLRRALQDGDAVVNARHMRASGAYAARNDLLAAVDHAVAAHEPEAAARLLEARGGARLMADAGVGRARVLLSRLPAEIRHRHPRLRLLHIGILLVENNASEACWDLERLQAELRDPPAGSPSPRLADDAAFQLDLALVETMVLVHRAEHELVVSPWADLDRVTRLAMTRFCEDWRLLGILIPLQVMFIHRYGPLSDAARYIARIETMYRSPDHDYNLAWVRLNRARECMGSGHLAEADRILTEVSDPRLAVARFGQNSFIHRVATMRARIAYLTGHVEVAARILDSIPANSAGLVLEVICALYVDRARCHFALGQSDAALARLDAADRLAALETLPHLGVQSACLRLVWLADSGQVEAMRALEERIDLAALWNTACEPRALPWDDVEMVGHATIRSALAQGRSDIAREAADRLHALAEQMEERPGIVVARLLRARALKAAGADHASFEAWAAAVSIAAEGGMSQPFVEDCPDMTFVNRALLDETPAQHALRKRIQAHFLDALRLRIDRDERLTPRERDVMYWLAQGQTTKEISRALGVSPETVKQHLKTIFSKLNVNTRAAAIEAVQVAAQSGT
ncbi:helix-turn-helix transcriptional regulator [Paraburkholderia sp. J63]|uniref:helix-turn-helix transcriptional regulator n=1 Tax=Paraburkholderia sp. J63 TaxID=2805434 RepID=UPI002ABD85A6|nr:LuxR C-terminal-related transcriptional regulator [Paraburkholderia sp. J63]